MVSTVLANESLGSSAKLVYLVLASSQKQVVNMSLATLVKQTSMASTTVRRAVKELVAAGFLQVERTVRIPGVDSRPGPSRYTLLGYQAS